MNLTVDYESIKPESVLELMKQGCKITFPTGYYLEGDLVSKYIQLGHPFGTDGLQLLTVEGAKLSIQDAKKYEIEELKANSE